MAYLALGQSFPIHPSASSIHRRPITRLHNDNIRDIMADIWNMAQEDKLKAIQETELKYSREIETLKQMVRELVDDRRTTTSQSPPPPQQALLQQRESQIEQMQKKHQAEIASLQEMLNNLQQQQQSTSYSDVERLAAQSQEKALLQAELRFQTELSQLKRDLEAERDRQKQLTLEHQQALAQAVQTETQRAIQQTESKYTTELTQLKETIAKLEHDLAAQARQAQQDIDIAVLEAETKYLEQIADLQQDLKDALDDGDLFASALPDTSAIVEQARREKEAALKQVEGRYQREIVLLRRKVVELQDQLASAQSAPPVETVDDRVQAYQKLLVDLTARARAEKQQAVAQAEARVRADYERIIANLVQSRQS